MDAPSNRPKFLKRCTNGVELMVEQIGPDQWCEWVYRGAYTVTVNDVATRRHRYDRPSPARTEQTAKEHAMAGVTKQATDETNQGWVDLSELSEEDWQERLRERGFPGYPPSDGTERWPGF
jgi:hypothetical protein